MTQDEEGGTVENPESAQPEMITITITEFEQLKSEVAESKDKYTRLLAESENARKRMQKERQEMVQYAIQNTIVDFLTPIDHMEGALSYTEQMSPEVKQWAIGFQMILGQFREILSNNGVTPFSSVGQTFDPHSHEAVEMEVTTEYAPGIIVSESLKGYKMGDRTIRPARVKVAKAPSPPKNAETMNEATVSDLDESAEETNQINE